MSIKSELIGLSNEDGLIEPAAVVDWAKSNPTSALHKALEWDDKKAAGEYRLWQARKLIKLHIVSDDGAPEVVSLSVDRATGAGYRRVDDVLASRDLSKIMLRDALEELGRVKSRYERIEELTEIWAETEKVRARISKPAQA